MNGILLDTHVWVWFMSGNKDLKVNGRKIIDEHLKEGSAHVAAISCWEIAMLESKERIKLSMPTLEWMKLSFKNTSLDRVELNPAIAYESCHLPGDFHGDPADRLIVATARIKGLSLVTRDKQILKYSKQDYVKTIMC